MDRGASTGATIVELKAPSVVARYQPTEVLLVMKVGRANRFDGAIIETNKASQSVTIQALMARGSKDERRPFVQQHAPASADPSEWDVATRSLVFDQIGTYRVSAQNPGFLPSSPELTISVTY